MSTITTKSKVLGVYAAPPTDLQVIHVQDKDFVSALRAGDVIYIYDAHIKIKYSIQSVDAVRNRLYVDCDPKFKSFARAGQEVMVQASAGNYNPYSESFWMDEEQEILWYGEDESADVSGEDWEKTIDQAMCKKHDWKLYTGMYDQFYYCQVCDLKSKTKPEE